MILFNLSGHGLIDMMAYENYLSGNLGDYEVPQSVIDNSIDKLKDLQPE